MYGAISPRGALTLKPIRYRNQSFLQLLSRGLPSKHVSDEINAWRVANIPNLLRGAWKVWVANTFGIATLRGSLYLTVVSNHKRVDLGLVGLRCVTTVGVNYMVDAFQNLVELENMKYHALGTGATPEGAGEIALVAELTTEYTPDNTRATGTTTEGASPNIYRTVATNTLSGAGALLREHGIFNQAATGGGVLLDRTMFALISLADGDSLQSTYELTLTAGS